MDSLRATTRSRKLPSDACRLLETLPSIKQFNPTTLVEHLRANFAFKLVSLRPPSNAKLAMQSRISIAIPQFTSLILKTIKIERGGSLRRLKPRTNPFPSLSILERPTMYLISGFVLDRRGRSRWQFTRKLALIQTLRGFRINTCQLRARKHTR